MGTGRSKISMCTYTMFEEEKGTFTWCEHSHTHKDTRTRRYTVDSKSSQSSSVVFFAYVSRLSQWMDAHTETVKNVCLSCPSYIISF